MALRALLRAAHEAVFVTLCFPEDSPAHARVQSWLDATPRPHSAGGVQLYESVHTWRDSDDKGGDSDGDADADPLEADAGVLQLVSRDGGTTRRLRPRAPPGEERNWLRVGGTLAWCRRVAPVTEERSDSDRYSDYDYGSDSYGSDGGYGGYGGGSHRGRDGGGSALQVTLLRRAAPRALAAMLVQRTPADADAAPAKRGKNGGLAPARYVQQQTAVYNPGSKSWDWRRGSTRCVALSELAGLATVGNALVADVARFRRSGRWYAVRGIPHRRGYLLHGPPGCGKAAMALALAAELGLQVLSLDLRHPALTDDALARLLQRAGSSTLVLMRRVDAAFDATGQPGTCAPSGGGTGGGGGGADGARKLSFSALLNVCDGVGARRDGSVVVFTSEAGPAELDAALARPGRIDVAAAVPGATPEAGGAYFRHFYTGHPIFAVPAPELEQRAAAFEAALAARERAAAAAPMPPLSMRALVSYLTTRPPARAVAETHLIGRDALQLAERSAASAATTSGGGDDCTASGEADWAPL